MIYVKIIVSVIIIGFAAFFLGSKYGLIDTSMTETDFSRELAKHRKYPESDTLTSSEVCTNDNITEEVEYVGDDEFLLLYGHDDDKVLTRSEIKYLGPCNNE